MTDEATDLAATARFLYEAGALKHVRRTGWWMAGIRDPESVAEHSWRTAVIATILAQLEGADAARATLLAVWHDAHETRTGDVTPLAKRYGLAAADAAAITSDQTTGMPAGLAQTLTAVVAEYQAQETLEARCAWDADKLECMIQGVEYRAQGHASAQRWIDNSQARLRTETGRRLANEVLAHEPLSWLRIANGEG